MTLIQTPVVFITGNRDGLVTTKRVKQYMEQYGTQIPPGVPCEKLLLESGATHIDNREENIVAQASAFLKKYLDRHRIESNKITARLWDMNRYRRYKKTKLSLWKDKGPNTSKTTLIDGKHKSGANTDTSQLNRVVAATPVYSSSRLKSSFSGSDSKPKAQSRLEPDEHDLKTTYHGDKDYQNAHSSTKSSDELNPNRPPTNLSQNPGYPLGIDPWAMLNEPQKGQRLPPVDDSFTQLGLAPSGSRAQSKPHTSPKANPEQGGLKLSRGLGGFGRQNLQAAPRSPANMGTAAQQLETQHPGLSHLDHFGNPYTRAPPAPSGQLTLNTPQTNFSASKAPGANTTGSNARSAYGVLASYQPGPGAGYYPSAGGLREQLPQDPREFRLKNQQPQAQLAPQAPQYQLHPERFDDEDLSVFLDERYNVLQNKDLVLNGTLNLDDSMVQDLNQLNAMLKAKPQPTIRYR